MDFEKIQSAMLILFDELKDDPESADIIETIDSAEGDHQLKQGMEKGIQRLRDLGKEQLAKDLEDKIKGW